MSLFPLDDFNKVIGLTLAIGRLVLDLHKKDFVAEEALLLVNRTLYERTLASGFGSVYFLLDASEQQQYKEAILLYAILLKLKKFQVSNRKSIGAECELFLYEKFKEQIEMPVDKAMDTLLRLGVISEFPLEGDFKIEVISCSKACETLRKRWNDLLDLQS